jgi:hypothetical protein
MRRDKFLAGGYPLLLGAAWLLRIEDGHLLSGFVTCSLTEVAK